MKNRENAIIGPYDTTYKRGLKMNSNTKLILLIFLGLIIAVTVAVIICSVSI